MSKKKRFLKRMLYSTITPGGYLTVRGIEAGVKKIHDKGVYEGKKIGYEKASFEYEEKLLKQANRFLEEKKKHKHVQEGYEQLLDEVEQYIEKMEKKVNKVEKEKEILSQMLNVQRQLKVLD